MKGKRQVATLLSVAMLGTLLPGLALGNQDGGADTQTSELAKVTISEAKAVAASSTVEYAAPEDTGALPPQMGWSTWNFFRQQIDQNKIQEVADAMVNSGLRDAGYVYLNIDDCWQSNMRDEEGRMMFDYDNFPDGPDFINQLHDMGLKVGLYSSCGEYTCEDLTASYGYEEIDALTFAQWGVDYLKYDYCHVVDMDADQGWQTLLNAPEVDYISLMPKNNPSEEARVVLEAENAALKGNAAVASAAACQGGKYVTGLNANGGSITFNDVTVDTAGEYILTIGFRKTRSEKGKFAEIVVNDESYETNIARTSGWSATGRQQLVVELQAGSNTIMIHNPIDGQKADSIRRYTNMGNALLEATAAVAQQTGQPERPIFFSISEHGRAEPWSWAGDFANSWRTGVDIVANWSSVVSSYESAVSHWADQKPGAYNDPDMMQVGNGNLTETENRSHFTLWCMLSAPLILGNDVRNFVDAEGNIDHEASNGAYDIVTNADLIAINQDLPLLQCKRISTANGIDILVKPLINQETNAPEVAVCFFNKNGSNGASAQLDLSTLTSQDSRVQLPNSEVYTAHELWDDSVTTIGTVLESGSIPAHGVKVYRVAQSQPGATEKLATMTVDALSIYPAQGQGEVTVTVTNMGRQPLNNGVMYLTGADGVVVAEAQSEAFNALATGESAQATFHITLPAMKATDNNAYVDTYQLSARTTFTYEGDSQATEKTSAASIKVSEPVVSQDGGAVQLGDAKWLSSTTGWANHPTRRNQSIDGNAIRINGVTYASGIGAHASSDTEIYVGGVPCTFTTTVGIDDEVDGFAAQWAPSVTFRVLADGEEIFATDEMEFGESQDILLNLSGCQILTLRADMGAANSSDHVGWGNAALTPSNVETHTITITQGANGTITASPAQQVAAGGTVTFTITPNTGYAIGTVEVNGVNVTGEVSVDETTGVGTYTVANVQEDLTATATYEEKAPEPVSENIAPEATASCPDGVAADGKQVAWVNDGIYDDQNSPGGNTGVFAFRKPLADNAWFDLTWDSPVELDRVVLSTYFGTGQGPTAFTVSAQYQGSETWTEVASRTGIVYETPASERMQQPTEIVFDETLKNVQALRVHIVQSNAEWSVAGVVTEFEAYGRLTHQVTFRLDNGDEDQVVNVVEGELVDQPAAPSKDGFQFDGWYTDEALTRSYDFQSPVTSSFVLYAKWVTNHTHVVTLHKGYEATCVEPGEKDYYLCTCGAAFEDAEMTQPIEDLDAWKVIPATGHKTQLQGNKEASCTEAGYTGDQVCTVCNTVVEQGTEIPATGHKPQLQGNKEATCTAEGYTGDQVCTVCNTVVEQGETIAKLDHQYQNGVCTMCGAKDPSGEPSQSEPPSGVTVEDRAGAGVALGNADQVFEPRTVVTVDHLTQGADYARAEKAVQGIVSDMSHAYVLDLNAQLDGTAVQPKGAMLMTFSIPQGMPADHLKLFRVGEDGTREEVAIEVDGQARTVTAKLTQLDTYVLADVVTAQNGATQAPTDPATGDSADLVLTSLVWLVCAAALTVVVLQYRRTRG